MDNLRPALQRLNIPDDRLNLVQARVEARLMKDVPAKWCADFKARVGVIMTVQIFSEEYRVAYHALRSQLVAQGILNYAGEHGLEVPDVERDLTPQPIAPTASAVTRPVLPSHMRPVAQQAIAPAPVPVAPLPVAVQSAPSAPTVDLGSVTPAHRETIHGMFVERNDGSWVLECDINRGDRIEVATIMDDGNDHPVGLALGQGGVQRIDLQLPVGRRPTLVVIVVFNAAGEEVGRGMIGQTAN